MAISFIPKIAIGVPNSGNVRIETALSLLAACGNTPNALFNPIQVGGCYVHWNREDIVLQAQADKATHLLWVDTDMIFPINSITTLLERNVPIIGANYYYKGFPKRSVIKIDPTKMDESQLEYGVDVGGKQTATFKMPKEPFKCRALGLGFTLVKMEVFDKLPRPWFFYKTDPIDKERVGEDVWFCDLAWEHGFEVWCDPTLEVMHVGTLYY